MWKEIDNCMADNYFMNNEDKIEDVWKTPRESWHTTCDGYIDTKDINDALKKVDGYSKILKTRKYDKTRINDIAIAMSYSSRADPGLRVAFKCLNV